MEKNKSEPTALTNSSSFYISIITLLELHVKKVIDRSLLLRIIAFFFLETLVFQQFALDFFGSLHIFVIWIGIMINRFF